MRDSRATLALARTLAGGGTEDHHRAASNRAYYAAFWHALARLRRDGEDPDAFGENSHNRVWDLFEGDLDARSGESIGAMGRTLKRYRVRADYRDQPVTGTEADRAVALAERLMNAIDALP